MSLRMACEQPDEYLSRFHFLQQATFTGAPLRVNALLMKVAGDSQQYAALPWRQAQGLEILLITSRETRRWVIPKGWPIPEKSAAESAAQEAYEEAGIRGQMAAQAMGHYSYSKRQRGGAKKRFRVDVFAMEVTEVLDLWPEAHERARQWLSPQEAAARRGRAGACGAYPDICRGSIGTGAASPNMALKQSGRG